MLVYYAGDPGFDTELCKKTKTKKEKESDDGICIVTVSILFGLTALQVPC